MPTDDWSDPRDSPPPPPEPGGDRPGSGGSWRKVRRAGRYYLSPRGARSLTRRLLLRTRLEAGLAATPLVRAIDTLRHPGLRYLDVDAAHFNARFPPARRQEVARAIGEALEGGDRVCYFQNLSWYNWRHRHLPRDVPALDDLYPPNVAVVDFLARHVHDPAREVLLDFACGIGSLLAYERELGFCRAYGFDNWTYLARSTAERFLRRFGLEASVLLDEARLAALPATVVTCIGFPLPMMMAASDVWARPSVRCLLADRMGRPATIPGFRRTGEYASLVTVFEK